MPLRIGKCLVNYVYDIVMNTHDVEEAKGKEFSQMLVDEEYITWEMEVGEIDVLISTSQVCTLCGNLELSEFVENTAQDTLCNACQRDGRV